LSQGGDGNRLTGRIDSDRFEGGIGGKGIHDAPGQTLSGAILFILTLPFLECGTHTGRQLMIPLVEGGLNPGISISWAAIWAAP